MEAVREVTEFAKSIPGFVDLDLNDQVRRAADVTEMCDIHTHTHTHVRLDSASALRLVFVLRSR